MILSFNWYENYDIAFPLNFKIKFKFKIKCCSSVEVGDVARGVVF